MLGPLWSELSPVACFMVQQREFRENLASTPPHARLGQVTVSSLYCLLAQQPAIDWAAFFSFSEKCTSKSCWAISLIFRPFSRWKCFSLQATKKKVEKAGKKRLRCSVWRDRSSLPLTVTMFSPFFPIYEQCFRGLREEEKETRTQTLW